MACNAYNIMNTSADIQYSVLHVLLLCITIFYCCSCQL